MKKRILVLNTEVSGMNKHLFNQLQQHGWEVDVYDVPFPKRLRWLAYVISFSFQMPRWKKKFYYNLDKLYKSSYCFKWRSKVCTNTVKVRQREKEYDLFFQISSMFKVHIDKNFNVPYAVLVDYTMSLSLKWDPWAPFKNEVSRWIPLEKEVYKNAKVIFTPSLNTMNSLKNDYAIDQTKIVKTGYGLNFEGMDDFEKDYDGKTVLFVGFDFMRKGGLALLDAFKKVRTRISDARLIIIGPSKGIYQIEQEGVEFLGSINDREIVRGYFKKASIFAMPSLCEPFGLVFLEAMAHKLPCVASNIDAMPEIIKDGETGYIVNSDDIDGLADRIIDLLSNVEKMRLMGRAAYSKIRESYYTWEQVGEIINKCLLEVVEI